MSPGPIRQRAADRCYPAHDSRVRPRFVALRSGLTVRVVECGPEDGPPIVLLPGWGASALTFRHQLPVLGGAGYRAAAVDLKGLGLSDKPTGRGEYTFPAMVRHVEEIVDAIVSGPATMVGQSMAGPLVIELARSRARTVSRLVLISPVGLGVIPFIRVARLLTPRALDLIAPHLVRRTFVRGALALAYGNPKRVSDEMVEEFWAPAQFPGFGRALRAFVRDFDWSPIPAARLEPVRQPTLLIRGTRDRLVHGPPRRAVTGLDRMTVVVVDGAGHAVNDECPEQTNAAILDFLRRHPT